MQRRGVKKGSGEVGWENGDMFEMVSIIISKPHLYSNPHPPVNLSE